MCAVKRGNISEPKFKWIFYYFILVPLDFTVGKSFTPLEVLLDKEERYRNRRGGTFETHSDYLPQSNYLFIGLIVGVYTNVFNEGAHQFVGEVSYLRCNGKTLLLIMNGIPLIYRLTRCIFFSTST